MKYEIVLPLGMQRELHEHLYTDRKKEQLAIVLCGVSRSGGSVRLLGRHLIIMPPETLSHQSSARIELDPVEHHRVLSRAAGEGLSQIDFHTHPGDATSVEFSTKCFSLII